jgi:hypothetical protein
MSHLGSAPLIKSKEQLEEAIEDYFRVCNLGKERKWVDKRGDYHCEILPISPNVQGLALHIGFNDVKSLLNIENRNDSSDIYAPIIIRAKTKIASEKLSMAEAGLLDGKVVTFYLAACHNMVPQVDININQQYQLSDNDRKLLTNLSRIMPNMLTGADVIDAESTEIRDLNEINDKQE